MLKILGKSSSINVRKVLWLCAELELPYEQEQWGSGFQPTDSPEFLALNPNGMVPVIRDGGLTLWESNTICRYLASKHARADLLPHDPEGRALVEQWMDWQATELNSAWRYAFMSLVRHSPLHKDAAQVEASMAAWNRHMSILDSQLHRAGAYVTGATFTLADIVIGLSTNRWMLTPMERPRLAAVEGYYELLSQRPGFQRHGRNGVP